MLPLLQMVVFSKGDVEYIITLLLFCYYSCILNVICFLMVCLEVTSLELVAVKDLTCKYISARFFSPTESVNNKTLHMRGVLSRLCTTRTYIKLK